MRSAIVAAGVAEAVERRQRHEHVVADAVDVDDDPVRLLLEDACRAGDAITIVRVTAPKRASCVARRRATVASSSPGSAPADAATAPLRVARGRWRPPARRRRRAATARRRSPSSSLHHLLHLRLFGAAVADDGPLDLGRRVLEHRQAGFDRRQHRDAARVPELQRAADVDRVRTGSRWRRSRAGTPRAARASRR